MLNRVVYRVCCVENDHALLTAALSLKLMLLVVSLQQKLIFMYNGLVHAHSGLRWIALLLLIVSVVVAISKWQGRSGYTDGNRKLYLFTLISVHLQLVVGLILYFISPKVNFTLISEKLYRFYSVEHITGMLIAIILVTIGYSRSKRADDSMAKQRLIGLFYGLGLLLILAFIPWPFRGLGSGWF